MNTAFQLSNVIGGNAGNGIGIYGASGNTIAMNNIGADSTGTLKRGNAQNGILVTDGATANVIGGQATGGNDPTAGVIVRPPQGNLISGNRDKGNGIQIDGHAHDNAIGGFQPSVEPQVTISANDGYGIAITGSAHDYLIFHTDIGTNYLGFDDLGNQLGGIELGPGSSSTTIGGGAAPLQNIIHASGGPGVIVRSSNSDKVLGNQITGSAGNGVTLIRSRKVTVGHSDAGSGNEIVGNQGYGLEAFGDCSGTVVQSNVFVANAEGKVNLTKSRGITYTP